MQESAFSPNCVGLNLENASFGDHDVVKDLQEKVAQNNRAVTGPDFMTVVLLENMTPDPHTSNIVKGNVQHSVEGALTAVQRVNERYIANHGAPKVKLQLANYGNGAEDSKVAVEKIKAERDREQVVAVVGLGQSLIGTRSAASDLSQDRIAVISTMASADNMNQHLTPGRGSIEGFFRITPTNADAAKAAVNFVSQRPDADVLLIQDTNPDDIYSSTLGTKFREAYNEKFKRDLAGIERFEANDESHGSGRGEYMKGMLADARKRVCDDTPDLVYFAGRGVDLRTFLNALSEDDPCPGMSKLDVLTSDDASNIVNEELPPFPAFDVRLFYTSVATRGQWDKAGPDLKAYRDAYALFESAFAGRGFQPENLVDGYAMATYDAASIAIESAQKIPMLSMHLSEVSDWIEKFDCIDPKLGATGPIAYSADPAQQGNPVDKTMSIMRLSREDRENGAGKGTRLVQETLSRPSLNAFDPRTCG
ncbi:ABC-type branched-subunit amino acid transport system substrate-binding protein [Saccharopolyspora dendranthemae]|uniref:ABC-type branched-subunit amino acid transport system substrate-binding protein n=1 Tax=Saccharopolyspora dendranthemae TaxID=1181886 RepID=A0A561U289_9PSEU|nr:ABC-type branched-subunit amino acid transport system substrate-binding protein [Saccharopolyspora dendranthemae]